MVASQPIRIGFIGCGNIANSHMSAIERIPEIEIVAGADINADRAREFVEKAGAEAYFTDWRQMLEEVELDAIDQCTPHTLHMEPTLAAAERVFFGAAKKKLPALSTIDQGQPQGAA